MNQMKNPLTIAEEIHTINPEFSQEVLHLLYDFIAATYNR